MLTSTDVPGHNTFGPIVPDDCLLAQDVVRFVGEPLAIVVAETRAAALAAKRLITADIEPLPPRFTIDEAIAAGDFLGPLRIIETGDVAAGFAAARHTLEGELDIGGQEHFYLESMAALAYPDEQGALTILSSTQHPSEVQAVVAEVLGIGFNQVIVQCKRMGGGFGGKETQAAQPAAMAALVAQRTGRPARIVLDHDTDMTITGKRHPFKGRYKVGFDYDGKLTALKLDLYSNGGCYDRPFDVGARAGDVAFGQRVLSARRANHRSDLQNEFAVEHRVPRLRRAAGNRLHREHFGRDRDAPRQRRLRRARSEFIRRHRTQHHAVRANLPQQRPAEVTWRAARRVNTIADGRKSTL
ncbi:MAG: molybdopterin-dependent oxidoreductase [Pirellulales bacterium]